MLDQRFANAGPVDHVEHAFGHIGLLGGADDRIGDDVGGRHVAAVGLEHHRAPGGQGGCGIAAGRGEGQREIARAEHRDRTDADPVLTQVDPWQRLTVGQGAVDARTVEIAATQDLGEQAHLATGACALTLNACARQRGFASDQGDETFIQCIQLRGYGVKEIRPARCRQVAKGRVSERGGLGGGVHFLHRGLHERVGQRFACVGVTAVQGDAASGTARTADVVVAEDPGH